MSRFGWDIKKPFRDMTWTLRLTVRGHVPFAIGPSSRLTVYGRGKLPFLSCGRNLRGSINVFARAEKKSLALVAQKIDMIISFKAP